MKLFLAASSGNIVDGCSVAAASLINTRTSPFHGLDRTVPIEVHVLCTHPATAVPFFIMNVVEDQPGILVLDA